MRSLGLWVIGCAAALVVGSCGGSGTNVSPNGIFTELQWTSVTFDVPKVTGISNNGVAVGYGFTSLTPTYVQKSLVWKGVSPGFAQPDVGEMLAALNCISPNGQYACGYLSLGYGNNLVYRINFADQTTAICVPPQYETFYGIYPMQTSDSGTSTGILSDSRGNFVFTYTSGDNIDIVAKGNDVSNYLKDYFTDVSLLLPPGEVSLTPLSYSHNRHFVAGRSGFHGCIWNVAARTVTAIDSPSRFGCQVTFVSDSGNQAVCEIDTSYLWDTQHGLRKAIDVLHANGFASIYPKATITAMSADGHFIAGSLGDAAKDYSVFTYRLP